MTRHAALLAIALVVSVGSVTAEEPAAKEKPAAAPAVPKAE